MHAEEEREITPELLTELSRSLRKKSKDVINIIVDLISVRERIREALIQKGFLINIPENPSTDISGYAIDSSFVQALPLVVGDFFLVTAGYIRYPRAKTLRKKENAGLRVGLRLTNTVVSSMRVISSYAHIIERKIGIDLVLNEENINAIFIDGPVLPLYLYYTPETKWYEEERQLVKYTEDLIALCKEKGITLIGVVKRVRSRFIPRGFRTILQPILGEKYSLLLDISNDKSLGSLTIKNGEGIIFGKVLGEEPIYRAIISDDTFGRFARIFLEDHPWTTEMEFAIIKPKRSRQIISVEALDYANIGFNNILAWINAHATHTGCPQILDYVDRYVQITSGLIEIARRLLIKIIAEKVRESKEIDEFELIELLLDYADLQKKYAPTMG